MIARKSGEEARLIEVGNWRTVDLRQDLLPGDTLRTNATGNLAILFSDRTQVRLGRNSTLVVRKIGGSGEDSELELQAGALWARAERGGDGVRVETPAAAAAIRGTDWAMQVSGDRTALTVLEGRVELSNAQGSVLVSQGEAASAAIGQAPTKILITTPKDREQQLTYLSLRTGFTFVPTTPLSNREMRTARDRIAATPERSRTAEDWVTLAEVSLGTGNRQATKDASARARALRLSATEQARLDLVDAMIAGAEGRQTEAARLFERAAPRLDPERRAVARYGGYFARSLADPNRVETPPSAAQGGPAAAISAALTAGFLQDIPAALKLIREAEARYPQDATLPAVRAQLALVLDDRVQAEEAINRALALDPDEPTALEARASYRVSSKGDLDGALADLMRAREVAPGSSTVLNAYGLVQSSRGADREAEAALKEAIAADPEDPVAYANLATVYLDQDRLREAKPLIDKALALDPAFDVGLTLRGRYRLQTGEIDAALNDLLAGTTASPSYAQGLLLLAAGYYEGGDRDAAEQALDNADRLDPNDPVMMSARTAIAIDDYDSDRAIESAQEALRRTRARGGTYAALSANRSEGSTLNDAFRLQGLNAWGRYYGDAVFDPFAATALVDQAVSGSADPFANRLDYGGAPSEPSFNNGAFSSFFQGLLLDPAILAGRTRGANLLRRPFIEGSLGGGFVAPENGKAGWTTQAEAQGFAAVPFPISFYARFDGKESEDSREGSYDRAVDTDVSFDLEDEDYSGQFYVAAKPTPNDRVVAYVDARRDGDDLRDALFTFDPGIPFLELITGLPPATLEATTYDRELTDKSLTSGLAWSHTFGYRNVASAAIFASGYDRTSSESATIDLDFLGIPLEGTSEIDGEFEQRSLIGAVNHSVSFDDLTLRYGIEGGRISQSQSGTSDTAIPDIGFVLPTTETDASAEFNAVRAYLDGVYEFTPNLKLEAGAFGTWLDSTEVTVDGTDGGDISVERFEPRAGLAWAPFDGQWLRAGFMRESGAFAAGTLAPVGVLGLQSNQLPLAVTGYSDTFLARWDAEWTDRLFTSLDYQHQAIEGLNIPSPGSLTTADVAEGRIDRVAGTVNFHLGYGLGLFGTYAVISSENEDEGANEGDSLPYVPEDVVRLGFTYVNPANVSFTLAATRIGEREGGLGAATLDPYWTTDASLKWEPFDKRFEVELNAYNLFGEEFEVAEGLPGWNRTFTGTFKVRF